jgi:hypothetical protein
MSLPNWYKKWMALYLWGWGVAAIVENFMYLSEEGFVAWLFFGEIIACFRALLWPVRLGEFLDQIFFAQGMF